MKRNKMKNRARKLISMVLATAILPCLFVSTAHAKEDKAMQYVDGNLDSLQVETGDLVYFGQDDDELSFDTCWQVLDAKQTNTGEDGMFLMTKNLVAYQDEKGILSKPIFPTRKMPPSSPPRSPTRNLKRPFFSKEKIPR